MHALLINIMDASEETLKPLCKGLWYHISYLKHRTPLIFCASPFLSFSPTHISVCVCVCVCVLRSTGHSDPCLIKDLVSVLSPRGGQIFNSTNTKGRKNRERGRVHRGQGQWGELHCFTVFMSLFTDSDKPPLHTQIL